MYRAYAEEVEGWMIGREEESTCILIESEEMVSIDLEGFPLIWVSSNSHRDLFVVMSISVERGVQP